MAALCAGASGDPKLDKLKLRMGMLADSAGNGKLTAAEVDELFAKLDADGDGKVTFNELHAYLAQSGLSQGKCEQAEHLFKELDKDGSGSISLEELQAGVHPDYAARYARGIVQAFLTKGRFIAYTSDIGESARPVMPGWFVNGAYGLTFMYVAVSVGSHTYESYNAGNPQEIVLRSFLHTSIFEVIASVAMPSLIIHQAVHFAQHQAHRLPPGPVARWVPTAVGLCCIPFLPYLDPPAEKVIDAAFEYAWPVEGDGHAHASEGSGAAAKAKKNE